jgi:elongation factor Ts
MEISAAQVKELRERTGAPMMNCKSALVEAGGDMAQAEVILRKKGIAGAAKKAARVTNEGTVGAYIHAGGKIGVLVEIACESDFMARTDEFQQLVHDVAMHVAAADPRFLSRQDVTPEVLEKEREIYRAQAKAQGKPDAIVDKMVEGKLAKYYVEACLLDQHFIKDDKMTVGELIATKIAKFGENIAIRRFARFKVGEEVGGHSGNSGSPAGQAQ